MGSNIENLILSYDSEGDTLTKRQLNVRISLEKYVTLDNLATHYKASKSAFAADLLEAAISDAFALTAGTMSNHDAEAFEAEIIQDLQNEQERYQP